MKRNLFFLMVFSFLSLSILAQEDSTEFRTRFIPLPNISYSPDTRLVLGAVILVQFKPGDAGEETRASNLMLVTSFSFNKQSSYEADYTIFLPQEKWFWKGLVWYQKWPENFWGIGPDTREEDEIKVEYNKVTIRQKFLYQVRPNVFLGPNVLYTNMYNVEYFLNGEGIAPPAVTGAQGGDNLGLGASLIWDKRNSVMTPTRDHYLEFSTLFFSGNWFGDYNYQSYLIDGRKYIDFETGGKSVLAFQGRIEFTAGDVPFRELALLGGNKIMRGYREGRFRDKSAAQLQAEFRQNIKGRIGVVAFGALGNVGSDFSQLFQENIKWTAGGGLRYNINRSNPTNIRIDYGIGKGTSGFYVSLGEAF